MKFHGTVEGGCPGLVAGGESGQLICRKSFELPTYSTLLDRDFAVQGWAHPSTEGRGFLHFGHQQSLAPEEGTVVCVAAHIEEQLCAGPPGRAWFVGARHYTRRQRDLARERQRLLPAHEVELAIAARTAAVETAPGPVFLSIHLNLFSWVEPFWPLGPEEESLWSALSGFQPGSLSGIEVIGPVGGERGAVLAAQLVRDLALLFGEV